MFSRRSRYYRLANTVTTDSNGYRFASKSLRPKAALNAKFQHTLDTSDRLDHLGYKYYKQSLHWWRICDANQFKSPRDLVDQTPFKTVRVNIRWLDPLPPWSDLFSRLRTLNGVDTIKKGNDTMLLPEQEIFVGPAMFAMDVALLTELEQSLPSQALTVTLQTELSSNGLILDGEVRLYQLGDALWRILHVVSGEMYFLRLIDAEPPATDSLSVFESIIHNDWVLDIRYNQNVISYEQIGDEIEDLGFVVRQMEKIGRAGKNILIPPRFVG